MQPLLDISSLEAAQIILGNSQADITQIYAERDQEKALKVIEEIG